MADNNPEDDTPERSQEDVLWDEMDRTPETIFRAIDALTMSGKKVTKAQRSIACERAAEDLLNLIAHHGKTGRWETLYDLMAIEAWQDGRLPTPVTSGRPAQPASQVARDQFRLRYLRSLYNSMLSAGKQMRETQVKAEKLRVAREKAEGSDLIQPKPIPHYTAKEAVAELSVLTGIDEDKLAELVRGGRPYEPQRLESGDYPDIVYMWKTWKLSQR